MRSRPLWLFLTILVLFGALQGCSEGRDKLLGNKRILRGGLGETTSLSLLPDRDTYVGTSKAIQGNPIPVGNDGTLDAQAYFSSSSWNVLPAGTSPESLEAVTLVMGTDPRGDRPDGVMLAASYNQGPFDSSRTYGDPTGPRPGTTLAQAQTDIEVGPMKFQLGTDEYPTIAAAATAPASFAGFAFIGVTSNGVTYFDAANANLWVIYRKAAGARDTLRTPLTRRFGLRSTLTPAPTGTETTLILGGVYDTGLLLRFPPLSVPEGSTVNQATLRLRLDAAQISFPDTVEVTVQRDTTDWAESVVSRDGLSLATTSLGVATIYGISATDSVLNITLPTSIIREWGAPGALNNGILVLLKQPYRSPPILVGSRESALPPEIRVSFTSPPPGRF